MSSVGRVPPCRRCPNCTQKGEDGLATRIPKYDYYPFVGGQRMCVGNNFALMEATIIPAAEKYRFTLDLGSMAYWRRQRRWIEAVAIDRRRFSCADRDRRRLPSPAPLVSGPLRD
ncbi:MAG: cytochrome P450 [Gammaproteobacteria bacterium]